MADITIVNGVYKPTFNWGAPSWREVFCDMMGIDGNYPWKLMGNWWEVFLWEITLGNYGTFWIFLGNWWEMIWEMIWKTSAKVFWEVFCGKLCGKIVGNDMVIYGSFWGIAGKWYGKWDSKKPRHVKGSFLWHRWWELMGPHGKCMFFFKKNMGKSMVYGTLTWDDMGTPVDNLWENWVEMVIYGKIYAKSLVNGYFWGKIPLVCL